MITLTDAAASVLTGSYTTYARYSSYLGTTLLASDIPADGGAEEGDRGLAVPERVTFTVPIRDRGTLWSPTSDLHPLAANGQRIRVELGVGLSGGLVEWFQRGEFVIASSVTQGETVSVECGGLLYLVEEARLVSPYQPTGTLKSTLRGLVEPAVSVVFDPLLADRSVPVGMNFSEDRMAGVREVLDAWPAEYSMDAEGYMYVYAPTVGTPVVTISDNVVETTGTSTREGAYNAVVARGSDTNGANVQGVAYDTSGGPKSYGGPFNPLPVPYFYQSPLLTTVTQARTAAMSILSRIQRETAREFEVEMVPDPRLQLGDTVRLTTEEYIGNATIETLSLPYGPQGTMRLTVKAV